MLTFEQILKLICLPMISVCLAIIVFTCWQALESMDSIINKFKKENKLKKEIADNILAATVALIVGSFILIGGAVYIIY